MWHHLSADLAEAAEAVGDFDKTILIDRCDVTGDVPAIADGLCGLDWTAQVSLHDVRSADQHFAVALCNEDVSCGCELASQRAEVVNLAVEDNRNRAVDGHERLPAQGKVDHRQPAMTEADRTVEMESVGVRAAMRERGRHQRQRGARTRIVGVIAGNAAHGNGSALEDDRLAPVAMKHKL